MSRPTPATLLIPTLKSTGLWPIALGTFAGLALSLVLLVTAIVTGNPLPIGVALGILLLSALLGMRLLRDLNRQLHTPLNAIGEWALQMNRGKLNANLDIPESGHQAQLAVSLNQLGDKIRTLSWDMAAQVSKQTEPLARKTRSLQLLYDVASAISQARDVDDLLTAFLHTLIEVVHAEAATVRLLTGDGRMRLVASNGFDTSVIAAERVIPDKQRGLCGAAILDGGVRRAYHDNDKPSGLTTAHYIPYVDDDTVEMVTVPLKHREKTLGVYNLFVRKDRDIPADVLELLTSIGQHLGMAIDKARVDQDATRLSLVEERSRLANELHDSLAQTLAGMKFQMRMLDDTLPADAADQEYGPEIENLRHMLDEAYSELRELISHFRAPVDKRGLIPALQGIIDRFKRLDDITIFFQPQCPDPELPIEVEVQVLRIVQEALANIRKHAHARTVRVLLRCGNDRDYAVLIEDDGVGIGEPVLAGKPGEHIGLTIMQERAQRIGGELTIESEPGEGTQVQLHFSHPRRGQPELNLNTAR
ncbi:MAG: GAF domain-containing protein [Gammaproteobacteria bacterium]|nr:GAF domain-containing protein [Gammaproteobacteria bacterium]MCP5136917.1 GAF domain-containing protein [Gammaproteobacteria bacterium]